MTVRTAIIGGYERNSYTAVVNELNQKIELLRAVKRNERPMTDYIPPNTSMLKQNLKNTRFFGFEKADADTYIALLMLRLESLEQAAARYREIEPQNDL